MHRSTNLYLAALRDVLETYDKEFAKNPFSTGVRSVVGGLAIAADARVKELLASEEFSRPWEAVGR